MDAPIDPAPAQFTSEQLSVDQILRFFHYAHLPMQLQAISMPFCALAAAVVETLPRNAERSVALRKLLEAKDAAVRANVDGGSVPARTETFYDRLLKESRDLEEKLEKLDQFMNGEAFKDIHYEEQSLLIKQARVMREYARILGLRIGRLSNRSTDRMTTEDFDHRQSHFGREVDFDHALAAKQSDKLAEEISEGIRFTGGDQSEKPIPFSGD
jgi:hypothetical protein